MKLSERDVCTKFITPALVSAGWDIQTQVREEVSFTKGRVIVRGKLNSRGQAKRADYMLYARPKQILNLPLSLPPLHEQHRIVVRVDELIALCDRLQADLATARDHGTRLPTRWCRRRWRSPNDTLGDQDIRRITLR